MDIAIIVGILVGILLFLFSQYNGLVKRKKKVEQAKSGIDVYLTQRFNLIPNLVECVKGYTKHEEKIFEDIAKMRESYMNSKDLKEGAELNTACNSLIAYAENYPELKASEQFLNLQKNLTKMESQLQAARRIYNGEVTAYNTKISVIPTNIIAGICGFKEADLFEIEEAEAMKNVEVKM